MFTQPVGLPAQLSGYWFAVNGTRVSTYQTRLDTDATSLMIGTRLNDSRHCFVGSIRNVTVYNRALSQYEVKDIYRSYMGEGKKRR